MGSRASHSNPEGKISAAMDTAAVDLYRLLDIRLNDRKPV